MSTLPLSSNIVMNSNASWCASLQLQFSLKNNKSFPSFVKHFGPLRVQRAFYPESSNICHSYILHPPGGIVGGDTLDISIELQKYSHAFVTTPGATKVYRSKKYSEINNTLNLEQEATLEWMPQETLLFSDSWCKQKTTINMHKSSNLCFWDIVCFGMPAINKKFTEGDFRQSLQINIDGKPILIEKNNITGSSDILSKKWGFQDYYIAGILVLYVTEKIDVEVYRVVASDYSSSIVGITQKGPFIICRALSDDAESMRKCFSAMWRVWRESVLGISAIKPRIWDT